MKVFDRVRTSQFGIPIVVIVGGVIAAVVTSLADDDGFLVGSRFVLPTTRDVARTLLSTVATSTITVAAIVFSVTAVVSQLSASQYSPRVLQGFLDDRYQQLVLGLVAGTFSFALIGQALLTGPADDPGGQITATVGMVLGVVSVLAIIGFIGRVTVRVRVDDTIGRIAEETTNAMRSRFVDQPHTGAGADEQWSISGDPASAVGHVDSAGWVSAIDIDEILDRLPQGGRARVDTAVGEHVANGDRIVTVWAVDHADAESSAQSVAATAVELRTSRDIEWDPGFGFRQLVDIALRALSPGVNDPNTAADVVRHMIEPLRIGMLGSQPARVFHGDAGRVVYIPHQPDWIRYFEDSFREIRLKTVRQPTVASALFSACGSLAEEASEPQRSTICAEIRRMVETVDSWELHPADRRAALSELRRYESTREIHDEAFDNDR